MPVPGSSVVSVKEAPLPISRYGLKAGGTDSGVWADNRTKLVTALADLGSGGQLRLDEGGMIYEIAGTAVPLGSGQVIWGQGEHTGFKKANGGSSSIFTNSNQSSGNTGLGFRNLILDGNKEGSAANSDYSVVTMDNLIRPTIVDVTVRGGKFNGNNGTGSGLMLSQVFEGFMDNIRAEDNDYDGVILGGAERCNIGKLTGVNNGRNALQLTRYPIGSGSTPSQFNVIGQVIHRHDTGNPTSGVTTTGGVYFHRSNYNQVGSVLVYGTRCAVGGGETAVHNQIGQVLAQTRYVGSADPADRAVISWENVSGTSGVGNVVQSAIIRPLSGASGRTFECGAGTWNEIVHCDFLIGGGSGNWTILLDASSTDNKIHRYSDRAGTLPNIADSGTRNSIGYYAAGVYTIKRSGQTAVVVA